MFTITINGIKPLGVQSTRFVKGHAYQDPRMSEYKDLIRSNVLANLPEGFVMYAKRVPLSVHFIFHFDAGSDWFMPMTTKPDFDNLAKGVSDAMNKVLWFDDSQIYDGRSTKYCAHEHAIIIIIREWRE